MIGQGVKNYMKNLKFVFNPLGTIALGFVFGLSILIPVIMSATNTLIETVKSIFANANIDFTALKDCLLAAFRALDWGEPLEAIKLMLSRDWLMQTMQSCLSTFVESMDVYTVPLTEAINIFCNSLMGGFSGLISCVILGVFGGYFLIKCLVRRNTVRRTFKKYILANIIDSVFSFIIIFVCAWLYMLWEYSIFISVIIAFIFFGAVALFEAYLVHGVHKVKKSDIVNGKNIVKLFVTDLIILGIAALFVMLLIVITNLYVGIFVGVALVQIAFVVIGLNAESYVVELVNEKAEKEEIGTDKQGSLVNE